MKISAFKSAPLLILLGLMGGCHQSPESKSGLGEGVLVRLDAVSITTADFIEFARQYQSRFAPSEIQPLNRRALLNMMVNQKVLARLAVRAGMDKDPVVLKFEGARREAVLAELYRKRLIKSIPGPAVVRMAIRDLPDSAFVQKASRRQLTPEYVQYLKIQWNYVHSEIEKAKVDLKVETNLTALDAIPVESLKPASAPTAGR